MSAEFAEAHDTMTLWTLAGQKPGERSEDKETNDQPGADDHEE